MNITFFIGGLSRGGAERVTCNLANYLVGKGHYVTIMTMADDTPSYYLDERIKRHALLLNKERKGFLYNTFMRFFRVCQQLRKNDADVYVVMLPITTIMLLQLRKLTKSKIIAAERVDPSNYSSKKQKQLKRLARRADGWVFQTKEEGEWYGDAVGDARVAIIPNAINPEFIKPVYSGVRKKNIVTVGRMSEQKNHSLLLKAFADIYKAHPDYKLIIYGEGEKKNELISLSQELQITAVVELPGYLTNIGNEIKDASIFVLSSDYEGMPNALMEAMALGIPCISTDCDGGGARFLIENEKNGILTPKGDVKALTSAIDRMLSDSEFAEHCGEEAHKICDRLAPEIIYGEWESFIMTIVKAN